jgi:multidrug transporter EmrE-like cation transporter
MLENDLVHSEIVPNVPTPGPKTNGGASTNPARQRSTANLKSVGLILISVLLATSGQLLFKAGLNQTGGLTLSVEMFFQLATNPLVLFGLGVFGFSALLWLVALMRADLSFAYPFLSLSYVLVLVGGVVLFHENITPLRLIGFSIIILGLFVVANGEKRAQVEQGESGNKTN